MVGGAGVHLGAFRVTARCISSTLDNVTNQDEWKNQALQLSLGIAFKLAILFIVIYSYLYIKLWVLAFFGNKGYIKFYRQVFGK